MRIVECVECGLVSGRELANDLLVTTNYSAHYFTDRAAYQEYIRGELPLRREVGRAVVSALGLFLPSRPDPRHLVDVGCGAGFVVDAAVDAGYLAVGVDPAYEIVQFARSTFRGRFIVGGIDQVQPPPGGWDAITLIDVLEHLLDPLDTLRQISSGLSPTGRILATVPGWGGWMSTSQGIDYYHFGRDHPWYFDENSLVRIFERAGLSVQHVGRFADTLKALRHASADVLEKYVKGRDHILIVASKI